MDMNTTFPEGTVFETTAKVSQSKDGPVREYTHKWDLSGCKVNPIIAKAIESLTINVAGRIRRNWVEFPAGGYTWNVADLLKGSKIEQPLTKERAKAMLQAELEERVAAGEDRNEVLADLLGLED